MAQAAAQDFRRASEPDLLEALADGQPLALAEAYHRLVPAAHAVARRLMPGAAQVEEVLLGVFIRLWTEPPQALPLEGWVRRTTWASCAERLRAGGNAPASPSASGLLPDLPAPDVRFLDAAERAIAELPDDQRQALLLAHDKGVATTAQETGADGALVQALLALAGPETSTTDRTALEEDPCEDLRGLGDWCLGIADPATTAAVERAIEERPGCAARSRTIRRGRRRIEGLPATPDMGQRILVSVLTSGGRPAAPAPVPVAEPDAVGEEPLPPEPAESDEPLAPIPAEAADEADPFADLAEPSELPEVEEDERFGRGAAAAAAGGAVLAAGADAMADTADLPAARSQEADVEQAGVDEARVDEAGADEAGADKAGVDELRIDEAGADEVGVEEVGADEPPVEAARVEEGADQTTGEPGDEVDWTPQPGDTAELRLSDILAEDAEEDDPFADLDRPDVAPTGEEPPAAAGDPYAALSDLDAPAAQPDAAAPYTPGAQPRPQPLPPVDEANREVFVEGQEHDLPAEPPRRRSPMAGLLSWLLPILGGAAIGVLIAWSVFGPPGGS